MEKESKAEKADKKKKKKKSGLVNTVIGGGWLANKALTRNAPLFALIVIYSFIYVSNRYEYERELMEIERLTKTRDHLKNNLTTLKSEFTSNTRPSQIEKRLEERGSDVRAINTPMITVKK